MKGSRWHSLSCALSGGALALALWSFALAEEPKVKPASKDDQRASGVVVKVEKAKDHDNTLVLSINTAAVWRDWVRDQSGESPRQSPGTAAREGNESIATKGEPLDNNLVKVEVAANSQVETRFRAPGDETSKGSKSAGDDAKHHSVKPTQYRVGDLKSGLFVEVDYRRKDECNKASTVAVIRPLDDTAPPAKVVK